jgi:hypothetical protein
MLTKQQVNEIEAKATLTIDAPIGMCAEIHALCATIGELRELVADFYHCQAK